MKKILFIILFSIFSTQTHAALLTCSNNHKELDSFQLLLGEKFELECEAQKIDGRFYNAGHFSARVKGYGPGLRVDLNALILTCPTVLLKNITKSKFYGIKASASLIAGVTVGVFANQRGGVCLLSGLNLGLGAGVTGVEIEFAEN